MLGDEKGRLVLMPRHHGFSLIELMVILAIVGVLFMVGAPELRQYTVNTKILAAAQGLMGAMQQARAEAIRLNTTVEVVITDSNDLTNPNSVTGTATGRSWMVRAFNPTTAAYTLVNAKASTESALVGVVAVNAPATTVTFNALGGTTLASPTTFAFTAEGETCGTGASGGFRCINVVVTPGGRSQVCDPAISTAGDARACVTT
jgi:type IV fimbrial biogenesis protein FimT